MTKEELEKEADEFINNHTTIEIYLCVDGKGRTKTVCDITLKEAYLAGAEPREKRIASLKETNKKISDECHKLVNSLEKLQNENAELKAKVGLSIDCEKAQKNGELCLGYGGDEDEPCEKCKNCIRCEGGYYQLGETEKDEQLSKVKDIIKYLCGMVRELNKPNVQLTNVDYSLSEAEQFLKE